MLAGCATAHDSLCILHGRTFSVVRAISNHGRRTLDTLTHTAAVLPGIHRRLVENGLRDSTSLLVDGGIRRGSDVCKALALGADAVLLGRPYIYALAGAQGVAHCLRLLLDELETSQALLGCADLSQAHQHVLPEP